jgi:thymidylate kinase
VFTVALIGADGAGKTTVGARLEAELGLPVKVIYMGVNIHSSSVILPHTRVLRALKRRIAGADPTAVSDIKRYKPPPKTLVGRFGAAVRSALRLVNWQTEEWYRQAVAATYTRRGTVVVFDRHFYADYYSTDVRGDARARPVSRRIHGFLLRHVYPKPDLVICLDAPPEVLFSRKPEGSLDRVRQKRREYLELQSVLPEFVVVDATLPTDEVTKEVATIVRGFIEQRSERRSQLGIRRRLNACRTRRASQRKGR